MDPLVKGSDPGNGIHTKMSQIPNTDCQGFYSIRKKGHLSFSVWPNDVVWLYNFFFGKKFFDSLKIGPNYFLQHFKNKIMFNFVKFVAKKMV
jgi:hypothetical protein